MAETLLEIHDLHAGAADREILKGIDLTIQKGEEVPTARESLP